MTKPETIATIKTALQGDVTPEQLAIWRTDERTGVQKLLASYDKRLAKKADQAKAFSERLTFERDAWQNGLVLAGVDEVGRGPLAGPVVAAAAGHDGSIALMLDSSCGD